MISVAAAMVVNMVFDDGGHMVRVVASTVVDEMLSDGECGLYGGKYSGFLECFVMVVNMVINLVAKVLNLCCN